MLIMTKVIEEIDVRENLSKETIEKLGSQFNAKEKKIGWKQSSSDQSQSEESLELKSYPDRKTRRANWINHNSEDDEVAQIFRQDERVQPAEIELRSSEVPPPLPSFTSSHQLPPLLKKDGSHNDLSDLMRARIRRQTKSAVEKQRGSVQLAKRLQRRMSTRMDILDDHMDENGVIDALNKSIRLVAGNRNRTEMIVLSMDEQLEFFYRMDKSEHQLRQSIKETFDETAPDNPPEPLIQYVRPIVIPLHQQLARESLLYFHPSSRDFRTENQFYGTDVRRLEEEGLYIGSSPSHRMNVLGKRLLNEPDGGNGWFTEDGRILGSGRNELTNFPLKPDIDDDNSDNHNAQLVFYGKAGKGKVSTLDAIYQLDIDIAKMIFTHHALFSIENMLGMHLLQLYRSYLRRSKENLAWYYEQRRMAVKQEILQCQLQKKNRVNEQFVDNKFDTHLRLLNQQLKELRNNRNAAEITDRQLINKISDAGEHLERIRQVQGFTCTTFRLVLKKTEKNVHEDRIRWDDDLKDELVEMEREFEECAMDEKDEKSVFNRDEVWQKLISKSETTRRLPGEPIISPELKNDAVITRKDQCPVAEQERRTAIESRKFVVRIIFNGLEVCKSSSRSMNADFCVTFGQIYNLQVYEWPQSIDLIILEKTNKGGFEVISSIGLPIPTTSQLTDDDRIWNELEFSSAKTEAGWNNSVGSGHLISSPIPNVPPWIPRTSAVLKYRAVWGKDKFGAPRIPPPHCQNIAADLQLKLGHFDPKNAAAVQEMCQLLQQSKFDPNDPSNVQFLPLLNAFDWLGTTMKDDESKGKVQVNCFRLIPEECRLISDAEFEGDIRFRLLKLRREQVSEFRTMKMVPSLTSEIDSDAVRRYEVQMEKERHPITVIGIDGLRATGNKHASMVRNQLIDRFSHADRRKTLADVVHEESAPTLFSFLGSLCCSVDLPRKLKPIRRPEQRVSVIGHDFKILANIQSGNNIPTRSTDPFQVQPFVQICFRNSSVRTSVVEGRNPNWQQLLLLDFQPPNDDFSQENLMRINSVLCINLYDQIVTTLPSDNREYGHTVHEQVEKYWLGSIQLPFSTLYWNGGKIEGSLCVKTPPLYLGYSNSNIPISHPYIKLIIAFRPVLPRPIAINSTIFETIESEQVISNCRHWKDTLELSFPNRRFVCLVLDTRGRTAFVNRFLSPIGPPMEIATAFEQSARKGVDLACRIVSFIPFLSNSLHFPDVWSTCNEFLKVLCGNQEEHSVLLWCWLTSLGLDCRLLLGAGLPEGLHAVYVLVRFDDNSQLLYNTNDGHAYELNDPFCPLSSVGTLISADNVYGNVQANEHPSRMRFDESRFNDWRPVFGINPGLESMQSQKLEYFVTDPLSVAELRSAIEREIRHHFDQWRPHGVPQWNFQAAKTLRDLLPLLEEGRLTADEHSQRLKSLTNSFRMRGMPLNMPYENVDKLVEVVEIANVHINFDKNVEFALAVHIHPYTNNILSCWIYIASLVRLS